MKIEMHTITVRELVEGYMNSEDEGVVAFGGKLDVRPKYQREFIYKPEQQEAVVDTLTKGYPLNVMYWADKGDGTYEVIDGQQRLLSILGFLRESYKDENGQDCLSDKNGFSLAKLRFLKELNGKDIDVSEVSVKKLKARMRRKARALQRWSRGEGKDGRMAVRAFIKYFNRKLYTSESASEVNWSWWYFPLITTDRSLKQIDAYMQDCLRYTASETHTKALSTSGTNGEVRSDVEAHDDYMYFCA